VTRNNKTKDFINWCNQTLKEQADECGKDMQKLYAIGYRQLSAYVHGSSWALRRQEAYIRKNYDQTVVMIDFANLTRMFLAIWIEWLKIMSQELGWQAIGHVQGIVDRCNELDEATLKVVTKIRKQKGENATISNIESTDLKPRCILCDGPAGEGSKSFSLTPDAIGYLKTAYPYGETETVFSQNVICAKCQMLSQEERQKLAMRAMARELKSYSDFIRDQI
jgi:hypothetical protein